MIRPENAMKNNREFKTRLLPILLCAALFFSTGCPAWAEEAATAAAPASAEPEDCGIIDAEELTALVEDFLKEHGMPADRFSLGYCYTATGDEWYYNGDTWYYPASMYKVPLMMELAEQVSSGKRGQDDVIRGRTVSEMEELILTYSNNDLAHQIREELGGDAEWRAAAKSYAELPDAYYSTDFLDYCYFTPRYMTQVLETLYFQQERFPNVIECLMKAQPKNYFRLSDRMNGVYDIAQKYGSFCDSRGQNFNHTAGIVYTPNPCIITVMTLNAPSYEKVISDAAIMLTEYTHTLDRRLQAYTEEKEQAEEAARLEAEAKALAEQQAQERAEAEQAAQEEHQIQVEKHDAMRKKLLIAGAALLAAAAAVGIAEILISGKKKRSPVRQTRPERTAPEKNTNRSARHTGTPVRSPAAERPERAKHEERTQPVRRSGTQSRRSSGGKHVKNRKK